MDDYEIVLNPETVTSEINLDELWLDGVTGSSRDQTGKREPELPEVRLDREPAKPCQKARHRLKRLGHGTSRLNQHSNVRAATVFPVWDTEVSVEALKRLARALDELSDGGPRLVG